ncbi:sensor domain-containing diguanylate cyclase [Bacillus sinesaloumensis]|uniref:sensor domain-containing diguanylate cyclase n=1 Tax=Litchfieldia sinesaloumensis TaxID=1926280 RepID=UPI0009886F84|nr:sensor domain-containing diguanylate cyclase [Bacillus sinesaloumensis]
MRKRKGLRIQIAISLLIIMTILCTLIVAVYSSHLSLKETLKNRYLENNYTYAKKLSLSTGDLFFQMQKSITSLGNIIGNHPISQGDLEEWRNANSNYFNSIFITDEDGVIKNISPEIVTYKSKVTAGTRIQSETVQIALQLQRPFISEPYNGTSGQLILLISAPIFNQSGQYEGLVGGTVYLEGDNALKKMLNNHSYDDGSYVFVVDGSGKIIYHPDSSRVNDNVSENKVVSKMLQGKHGSEVVNNTNGKDFFAGYAIITDTGWGIVSQTPITVLEEPLQNLVKMMIYRSFPLLLLILIIGGALTINLSKPINRLARLSEVASTQKNTSMNLSKVLTKSNIYEIRQLYHHIANYFTLLNNQIQLDGLTGLVNRRTFDLVVNEWLEEKLSFSLIILDIDYFKKVNDTFGHLIGDDVLKQLAELMKSVTAEEDICFRYGGEEFGILMLNKNQNEALEVADALRRLVESSPNPTGQIITISLGVTTSGMDDQHAKQIVERADIALYESKKSGRNRTTLYAKTKRLQ